MEKNSALRADNKKLSHILVSKTSSSHSGNASFRLAALAITVSGLLFASPTLIAAETATTADLVLRNGNIYTA
ncbi:MULTISPECIES: hypothetical protein [Pectobacterium]|uniref:hypothetical protein n=1 Tax=Pectobacterium TaxID=122277 RepID=UPI001E2E9E99|nr:MULTISPECIES: hypothetical protein [Pectobacterium]MBG0752555.1 hypothetical protein [Pectobacterium carotovorum subsp. carotovorum PCCS1]UUE37127.1 hypothetical protein L0Y26_04040 [Pectobacterium aroidearum]UUE41503.1 hypothetical protein L0Y25_04035 [Pectobacterium aroidearum]